MPLELGVSDISDVSDLDLSDVELAPAKPTAQQPNAMNNQTGPKQPLSARSVSISTSVLTGY